MKPDLSLTVLLTGQLKVSKSAQNQFKSVQICSKHFQSVEKLGKILQFLSKFGNEGSLLQNHIIDIVITQSVDEDAPETVVAVEDLLKRYNLKDSISETTLFRSLKHVKVPLMKHDDSLWWYDLYPLHFHRNLWFDML